MADQVLYNAMAHSLIGESQLSLLKQFRYSVAEQHIYSFFNLPVSCIFGSLSGEMLPELYLKPLASLPSHIKSRGFFLPTQFQGPPALLLVH
jgi:hypothetical protein